MIGKQLSFQIWSEKPQKTKNWDLSLTSLFKTNEVVLSGIRYLLKIRDSAGAHQACLPILIFKLLLLVVQILTSTDNKNLYTFLINEKSYAELWGDRK